MWSTQLSQNVIRLQDGRVFASWSGGHIEGSARATENVDRVDIDRVATKSCNQRQTTQ